VLFRLILLDASLESSFRTETPPVDGYVCSMFFAGDKPRRHDGGSSGTELILLIIRIHALANYHG
jgi:hypothetical protein